LRTATAFAIQSRLSSK